MQNSKNFLGTIPRTPVLGGEESLFSFFENIPKLSYCDSIVEFKNFYYYYY